MAGSAMIAGTPLISSVRRMTAPRWSMVKVTSP
ncbi:hypothetical protein X728_30540 [Mesorhizobium sp. L103C120A0]|nr:hypothetical protein X728_30540 [Mesorhizobium sp. L103C120A0]